VSSRSRRIYVRQCFRPTREGVLLRNPRRPLPSWTLTVCTTKGSSELAYLGLTPRRHGTQLCFPMLPPTTLAIHDLIRRRSFGDGSQRSSRHETRAFLEELVASREHATARIHGLFISRIEIYSVRNDKCNLKNHFHVHATREPGRNKVHAC
jgi:hypothetical protein